MTVKEADLPGVGKKHEIELDDGSTLVIITQHSGKRDVYHRVAPDEDSEKLFTLSDELARQIGTILEGAYFQPVASDAVETMLSEGTFLEWYDVSASDRISGLTLGEQDLRQEYGVTIVAIQRGDEVIPSPGADTEVQAADTLVVIGSRGDCDAFVAAMLDGD